LTTRGEKRQFHKNKEDDTERERDLLRVEKPKKRAEFVDWGEGGDQGGGKGKEGGGKNSLLGRITKKRVRTKETDANRG